MHHFIPRNWPEFVSATCRQIILRFHSVRYYRAWVRVGRFVRDEEVAPGHPPSLIRVFAVRSMDSWGPNVSSCGRRRLWSDRADAQADLCLRWAQWPFCYTPGIYAEGCIIFVFPFVRSYVRSFVRSFVFPSRSWNYFKVLRASNSSGVYLTNHSSESIHIWTIGTLEGRLSFHDSSPQGPWPGVGLEVKI